MQALYPISAVAKITGVSLDTLRAWERRHRAVVPERSERGRQYSGAHIERLLLLRQLVQQGHAIGGIAARADHELKALLVSPASREAKEPEQSIDLLSPVLAAIEKFDSRRAGDELSRLAAILSPRDVVYQVAVPLMREVGARCHAGSLGIAEEHLTSELLRNLLGSMMRLCRPAQAAMKMVLATPAGEPHGFGILAAAMLASIHGSEPVYLGPNLPAPELANAAQRVGAQVVLLGITVLSETTADEVRRVAETIPEKSELWIGGASGHELDLSELAKKTVLLEDLPAFENECRRWRSKL